jgi:uncharacterized protein YcbX
VTAPGCYRARVRTVARINVTPLKSSALHHPDEVRLERSGPVHDRLFFFVDAEGKRFGGDAKAPLMSIHAEFDDERDRLSMRLPDGSTAEGSATANGEAISVTYDGRSVPARLVEGDWTRFLSGHVGRPVRMARLDEPGTLVDEGVTIVSLASVEELGRRAERETPDARRFRMTFELDGCEAHEEDAWTGRRVVVGEAELVVGGPVPRCVITTLDPDTGRHDFPTLKVIAGYRKLLPDEGAPVGVYAQVSRPGTVRVGDAVEPIDDVS